MSNTPEHLDADGQKFLQSMRLSRIILPVMLGIAAVAWLFYTQFDITQFRQIQWTARAYGWIGAAFVLLIIRHLFYSLRMRVLTGGFFSWWKCIQLIVLWEFSSALTPTSKGGPFVMLFVLTREKLAAGRTAAAVFYTMICDSGFFIITLPILLAIYGPSMIFPGATSFDSAGMAADAFFITYGLMTTYWFILMFFLLVRPQYTRVGLNWLARRKILKRWSGKIAQMGDEFEAGAMEMRKQDWRYHLGVITGTVGAWTSKFIMINCLILAIRPEVPLDGFTQSFIYGRLVAMFVIMSFSPTPGGAGLAELALVGFISDYVPKGIAMVVALMWRGMAYYGYLLMGAIMVPGWISKHIGKKAA